MSTEKIKDVLDNPLFFIVLGVVPAVIGVEALFLWFAKNANTGGGPGGFGSLARLIQKG